jgi:hypothetical protein
MQWMAADHGATCVEGSSFGYNRSRRRGRWGQSCSFDSNPLAGTEGIAQELPRVWTWTNSCCLWLSANHLGPIYPKVPSLTSTALGTKFESQWTCKGHWDHMHNIARPSRGLLYFHCYKNLLWEDYRSIGKPEEQSWVTQYPANHQVWKSIQH